MTEVVEGEGDVHVPDDEGDNAVQAPVDEEGNMTKDVGDDMAKHIANGGDNQVTFTEGAAVIIMVDQLFILIWMLYNMTKFD